MITYGIHHLILGIRPRGDYFSFDFKRVDVICWGIRRFFFLVKLSELVRPFLSSPMNAQCSYNQRLTSHICDIYSLLFPFVYISCKLYFRDRLVPLDKVDFSEEMAIIDKETEILLGPGSYKQESAYDRVLNMLF